CGSGAFLLGALDRLATIRIAAGEPAAAARRQVLRNQLFGVDLDGMAVRLAELRLWLAVVSDDDAADPRSVRPLPNLDALIRQGNSLHQPDGARVTCAAQLTRRVGEVRRRLVGATGEAKRGLTAELRRMEREVALASALGSERIAASRLDELLDSLRAPTLFGDRSRLSADSRRQISALRQRLRAARATRRALEAGGEVPWFQYESHFPDVMARGGFDIVAGNPPWVRAEELPAAERERLADRYRWWRGERGTGFRHRPDLAVAFIERAHELVAPGGAVALLVPAKIASASYAATARSALVRETTIHAAADLTGESRARFGATVYPMAVITSRRT